MSTVFFPVAIHRHCEGQETRRNTVINYDCRILSTAHVTAICIHAQHTNPSSIAKYRRRHRIHFHLSRLHNIKIPSVCREILYLNRWELNKRIIPSISFVKINFFFRGFLYVLKSTIIILLPHSFICICSCLRDLAWSSSFKLSFVVTVTWHAVLSNRIKLVFMLISQIR